MQNQGLDALQTILKAAKTHKDIVYDRLSSIKDGILSGEIKIKFHVKCRANYTNWRNVNIATRKVSLNSANSGSANNETLTGVSKLRHFDTSKFNIQTNCFICGNICKKMEKLTQISTGNGATTCQRVLDAAIERNGHCIQM